jgi:two-component system sensor histidine kinase DctS
VDSAPGRPSLIPNLTTALVLGLSIALFGVVLLLARDVRRRAEAERALAEALAFRKAMEDSLVTGLRARDLRWRITYVNPAFCAMVGFSGRRTARAGAAVLAAGVRERVPAAPGAEPPRRPNAAARRLRDRVHAQERRALSGHDLRGAAGRRAGPPHRLDERGARPVSAQRRVEELSRQQQDRLQATARLATVGEMASLLSHELNQPLAAIASYASGSLNLLDAPDDRHRRRMLRQALERIAEQAERAGRIIKSVHDFVRRREQAARGHRRRPAGRRRAAAGAAAGAQERHAHRARHAAPAPRVVCDRTMVEQVLLNLTRNGIQAMEATHPLAERVLRCACARRTRAG